MLLHKLKGFLKFSLIFALILSPNIGVGFLSHYLTSQKSYHDLSGPWEVKIGLVDKPMNVKIPSDLRTITNVRVPAELNTAILTRSLDTTDFSTFSNPILYLGRIGDADEVFLDDCYIGRTGINQRGEKFGWFWAKQRIYEVPKNCIKSRSQLLKIKIQHYNVDAFGIFSGPIGIAEANSTITIAKAIEFLRLDLLRYLATVLFAISAYFAFVSFYSRDRIQYVSFSATSFSLGVFILSVSSIFYFLFQSKNFPARINVISAFFSCLFFSWFISEKFRIKHKYDLIAYSVFSIPFLFLAITEKDFSKILQIYVSWFPIFIILFIYKLVQLVSIAYQRKIIWSDSYFLGIILVLISTVFDAGIITVKAVNQFSYIMPFSFAIVVLIMAIAQAKEYADAFSNVELQVEARTKDLALAIEQLKSLEKMKERFFANVSHDFKTPIAVALGAMDEFRTVHAKAIAEAGLRALQPAERSLKQLLRMVSDLLDVAKAESGTLKVQWELVKPAELLGEMALNYEVLCRQKGLAFELQSEGFQNLAVPMDASRFSRVVQNLLSNAIKFTDARADRANKVMLRLDTNQARMMVEVHDSGMGIPANEREKVFDRFYQSSLTSLREHGGSGIGLSFVKESIEAMNGTVMITDSPLGGTCFVVSLPLSQDVEVTGERKISGAEFGDIRGSLDVAYPRSVPEKEKMGQPNVLLAEDNPEVAQISYSALEEHYNVYFAADGRQALAHMDKYEFDCVISDIVMPQMRGDELVEKIRARVKHRDTPIVMLSSHGDEETIVRLLNSGANDYVTKPFRREILQARVKSQIETHRLSRWISQNEKVMELGLLASGMAHQIRNGLNSLRNQFQIQERSAQIILDQATALPPEKAEIIKTRVMGSREFIEKAIHRIENLTNSIHSYSSGSRKKTEVNIAAVVNTVSSLLEDKLKNSEVKIEVEGEAHVRFMGYAAFQEAILNIISNAIEIVPQDGTGKIKVSWKELENDVEVKIEDNGPGIDPAILHRICQPFFTTKAPGKGTGLGLYIVRDVVEGQHGGTLSISAGGRDGKGAGFVIKVPKVAPEVVTNPEIVLHGVDVA